VPSALPVSLFLKHKIIGTPLEPIGKALRRVFDRRKNPDLWEIYLEDYRLPFVLAKLLRHDSSCVDIGCHIGSFLSSVVRLAPNGEHYAFEPSQTKAEWLRKKFSSKATVFQNAVSDTPGQFDYVENLSRPGLSGLRSNLSDGEIRYQVAVCRLDDVLSDRRIDLIKIDVEGHELEVIKGARQILTSCSPPLIFECTNTHPKRSEIFEELRSLGYSIFTYVDFLFGRGELGFDEFARCGIYPFRALNFFAIKT